MSKGRILLLGTRKLRALLLSAALLLSGCSVFAGGAAPYSQQIQELRDRHLLDGLPDAAFAATKQLTRGEAMVVLDGAYLLPEAAGGADQDLPRWAAPAVARAVGFGLLPAGEAFAAGDAVSREQAVAWLVRILTGGQHLPDGGAGLTGFGDAGKATPALQPALGWAAAHGLVSGRALRPGDAITHGEFAQLITLARQHFDLVTVIGLTETHGGVEPRLDPVTKRQIGGAAAFAGYVADRRIRNRYGVVVVDTGDSMQETMISNLSRGKVVVDVFNAIGVDASTLGNHEFDWTVDVLRQRAKEAKFPYVATNVVRKDNGRLPDFVRPALTVVRHKLSIALVAAASPRTASMTMPANVREFTFGDPAAAMNRVINGLRPQVDLVIAYGHMGVDKGGKSGELLDTARRVQGPDAWLAGHVPIETVTSVDGLPVVQGGKGMTAPAEINFVVDPSTHAILNRWSTLRHLYTDQWPADPEVAAIVKKYQDQVAEQSKEVVAEAGVDLTRQRFAESALGDWVADVMRAKTGTQVAFTNGGGLRTDLARGQLTYGQLYNLIPFDNVLVTLHLTGAQLKAVLEAGVSQAHELIQVSGLRFAWDAGKPAGQRVSDVTVGGQPLDLEASYSATTQDFLATGGDDYAVLAGIKDVNTLSVLQRDAIISAALAEARAGRTIAPQVDGRITNVGGAG